MRNELTERQLKIHNYIMENPGKCQQDVVRFMGKNDGGSRIPVLNDIIVLKEEGLIVVKKDRPSSQIYKLYINNENILSSNLSQLESFKASSYRFLVESNKKFKELEFIRKNINKIDIDGRAKIEDVEFEILKLIISVHTSVFDTFIGRALFEWPQTVHDQETLDKMYDTVFRRLREILAAFNSVIYKNMRHKSSYLLSMLMDSYKLDSKTLDRLNEYFEFYGLGTEFQPLKKVLLILNFQPKK